MIITAMVIGGVGYACYHWGKQTKEVITTTTTTTTTKDGETTTKVIDKKMSESEKTQ